MTATCRGCGYKLTVESKTVASVCPRCGRLMLAPKDANSQQTQEAVRTVSELVDQQAQLDPFDYFVAAQAHALFSLAGCFVVVALVLAIAYIAGRGHVSKIGLLISGQVFTAIIQGVIDMIRYYIRDHGTEAQMTALRNAVGGGFENMWSPLQVPISPCRSFSAS